MYNHKLTISYDGTLYKGWQIQKNAHSIQETIQNVLRILFKEDIKLIGSGRTDTGVHAKGQVANFLSEKNYPLDKILYSLNGMLPQDIRILSLEDAPASFHAQYSALGKIYHYHLILDPVVDPTKRLYTHHVKGRFDLDAFREAAPLFLGKHDFTSFANEADYGSAAKDPIRTLKRIDIIREGGNVRIELEADGFLYKMVRNIVGTLLEVGYKKKEASLISEILAGKDRRLAGSAAPAQGLFLMKVIY